jgi:hypothetical protein
VQYYQNLLTEIRPEYEGTKNSTPMDGDIVEVKEETVRKAVRELKNGKSCGPEGQYAEMLEHGTDELVTMLTWVINRCLNGEEFATMESCLHFINTQKRKERRLF